MKNTRMFIPHSSKFVNPLFWAILTKATNLNTMWLLALLTTFDS